MRRWAGAPLLASPKVNSAGGSAGAGAGSRVVAAHAAAYLALVVYQLVMAVWAVVGSRLLNSEAAVPLATFLLGRHLVASSVLGCVACWLYGRRSLLPQRDDVPAIALAGVLAQWASPVFYLWALRHLPATISAIFDGPFIPVLVYVMAVALGVEVLPAGARQRMSVFFSLVLSCGGAALIIVAPSAAGGAAASASVEAAGGVRALALLALLVEALALALSLIVQKPLATKYPLFAFACWMSLSGLVSIAVQAVVAEELGLSGCLALLVHMLRTSRPFLVATLYNALGISVINALCSAFANSLLPSSLVALAACLQPAFTLLLDVAAYGAPLHLEHVAGLAAVGLGIRMFTRNSAAAATAASAATAATVAALVVPADEAGEYEEMASKA
jgi:drug/metabolite transporter (DMT)-like permease